MVDALGTTLLALLAEFSQELRMAGYEVLVMGDMNGCTKSAVGFDGDSPIFGDCPLPEQMTRRSDCKHQRFNSNGHAILGLCEQAELVFLNGLEYLSVSKVYNSEVWDRCTRPLGQTFMKIMNMNTFRTMIK